MRAFSRWFTDQLRAKGLSTRAFAARVYASKSTVAGVTAGTRPPPVADVMRWAAALDVDAADLPRVELLAALAHSPQVIEEQMLALEQAVQALRQRIDQLEAASPPPARPARRRSAAKRTGRR